MGRVFWEGEPERSKGPGEQRPRPDLNRPGSRRGHGFFGGMENRWSSGVRPRRFDRKEPERKKRVETLFSIPGEEKGFEGRNPRAWEAERGLQGLRGAERHREGSQTLRMGLPRREAKRVGRFVRLAK